jgi:hypothetical protein
MRSDWVQSGAVITGRLSDQSEHVWTYLFSRMRWTTLRHLVRPAVT